MKTDRLPFRAWVQERIYWLIRRPTNRALNKLARALPDSFRRRVWYTVTADATTSGPLASKAVPSVTLQDVMQSFPTGGSR